MRNVVRGVLAAVAVGASTLAITVAGSSGAAAIPVPPAFTDTLVAELASPTGLTELGDGRLLVLSKGAS